jgi:hypothetical protein
MMKKLLFLFCLNASWLSAQPVEPTNQYDARHKKQGYWKIYFDDCLYLTDSASASYFGYDYYKNGKLIISCLNTVTRKKNMVKLEHEGQQPSKSRPIALDGLFKTYDEFGLAEELLYQHGIFLKVKNYFRGSTVVMELIDYTQHYQGNEYSFRYQLRKKDGSLKLDEWITPNEKGVLKRIKIQ